MTKSETDVDLDRKIASLAELEREARDEAVGLLREARAVHPLTDDRKASTLYDKEGT